MLTDRAPLLTRASQGLQSKLESIRKHAAEELASAKAAHAAEVSDLRAEVERVSAQRDAAIERHEAEMQSREELEVLSAEIEATVRRCARALSESCSLPSGRGARSFLSALAHIWQPLTRPCALTGAMTRSCTLSSARVLRPKRPPSEGCRRRWIG